MSHLVAIAYDDLDTAQQVVGNIGQAQAAHEIELDDLVIVERRGDGKISRISPRWRRRRGRRRALGWPDRADLPDAAVRHGDRGRHRGRGQADRRGVDDNFMKELGTQPTPGSAAVIASSAG